MSLKINDIISWTSLLISGVTLIILYLAYKRFIKQQFATKQLETVLNLISEIQDKSICFIFIRDDGFISYSNFTLFEVARFVKGEQYRLVYHLDNSKSNIPFLKYLSSPLIPKSIAKQLEHFLSRHEQMELYENLVKEKTTFVVIAESADEFVEAKKSNQFRSVIKPEDAKAYESWTNFIECSKNLERSIYSWVKKYGINDLNISVKDINIYKGKNYQIQ